MHVVHVADVHPHPEAGEPFRVFGSGSPVADLQFAQDEVVHPLAVEPAHLGRAPFVALFHMPAKLMRISCRSAAGMWSSRSAIGCSNARAIAVLQPKVP